MEESPVQAPTPSINVPPVNNTPQSVAPIKLSSAKLVAFMFILIILLLGTTVFFFYQNSQLKKQVALLPTPSPIALETPDPTADWKTYLSQDFGFSFKYPGDIFSHEDVSQKNMLSWTNKAVDDLGDVDDNTVLMNLYIYTNFDANELNKYTADTWTISYLPLKGAATERSFTASYLRGKVVYQLVMNAWTDETLTKYEETFNQILSTFKFIEATNSASPTQKACTLEAKICPDGTSVGRTGPNCEFAACP